MPHKIGELPRVHKGRETKYDFTEHLKQGGVWLFVQGEDFDCKPQSIRPVLKRNAASFGKFVRTRLVEQDGKPAIAVEVVDTPPRDEDKSDAKADNKADAKAKQKAAA